MFRIRECPPESCSCEPSYYICVTGARTTCSYSVPCLQMNRQQRLRPMAQRRHGQTVGKCWRWGRTIIHCGLVGRPPSAFWCLLVQLLVRLGATWFDLVEAACVRSAESVCAKLGLVPSRVHLSAMIGWTTTNQSTLSPQWRPTQPCPPSHPVAGKTKVPVHF